MTADHWQTKENAEFLRQLGFYHGLMRLNSGDAVLKGITFSDGTIEFDVNTIGRGAPGIAFRQQDQDNFELLPLRENGWNHIQMVVSGRRMNIFVSDATTRTW